MTTAGGILETAVLDLGGVVSMTGPGTIFQIGVITGTGVLVVDYRRKGGTAGVAVQKTT